MSLRSVWLVTLSLMLLGVLGGCSKKIWITQYPAFYNEDMKGMRVLVRPFDSPSYAEDSGKMLSEQLATAMMANGTYTVYSMRDIGALLEEADRQSFMTGGDANEAAKKLQKLGKADALLTGSITNYTSTSKTETKDVPIYDPKGRITNYLKKHTTRNEANVAATARLIGTDGTLIHAVNQPVTGQHISEGSPPNLDPHGCLAAASEDAVQKLMEEFAVVRKQVKINTKDALITATEKYDNQWVEEDTFSPATEQMFAVVTLPVACDRNRFRLAIVKKDQREILAEETFTWTRGRRDRGFMFSPKELAEKAGPGEFELKFYSGPEPVIVKKFSIIEK